jgi:hypothetical protein
MSEREIREFLHHQEGIEKSPEEHEAEIKAWYHAVSISDYIEMFRAGVVLKTTIYGSPYPSYMDALRDCGYSDRLAGIHSELTSQGFQTINIAKPRPEQLFPGPVSKTQAEHQSEVFTSSNSDHFREVYQSHFHKMMYGWGFRDILLIGVQGYLDQVPYNLSLFTFCGPGGTKSFISQDGYFATNYDLTPDFERPISQRGGQNGFMRSYNSRTFDELSSQIAFLTDHVDNFAFDDTDLLGYRPKDMTESGIASAWDGWSTGSTPSRNVR